MEIGAFWRKKLEEIAEKYVIYRHELSLSVGSPDGLDLDFIKRIKYFLDEFNIDIYSEHLSYSKTENANLYDLLPVPFRKDVIKIYRRAYKNCTGYIKLTFNLKNISYYTLIASEIKELDFLQMKSLISQDVRLDTNNVYINIFNHQYEDKEFLLKMPLKQVRYVDMDGHEKISKEIVIDLHG